MINKKIKVMNNKKFKIELNESDLKELITKRYCIDMETSTMRVDKIGGDLGQSLYVYVVVESETPPVEAENKAIAEIGKRLLRLYEKQARLTDKCRVWTQPNNALNQESQILVNSYLIKELEELKKGIE